MRNLTKTVAVLSLLAPASAYSLGVGDIRLHSSLNQKLDAEIALSLGGGENPGDVRVKLAPIEKFDQNGIPWAHFLSKIKFEPVVKKNGAVVIKVTSHEVVNEPFLNFLLEVSTPEGNQYREFTVLVDPPSSYGQRFTPATALPALRPRRYVEPAVQSDSEEQPRARAERTPRQSYVEDADETPGAVRVRSNDSLSRIAARLNHSAKISDEQMALALFEANPQAFFKDNINALSAGALLKVPGRSAVLRLSRRQATAEFRRQNIAWRRGQATTMAVRAPQPEAEVEEGKLTLAAPSESEVGEQAEVSAAPAAKAAVTGGEAAETAGLAQKTQENQRMQERLHKLEQQMEEMQKIIALKDQQLAALQSLNAAKPAEGAQQTGVVAPLTPASAPEQPEATAPPLEKVPPQPVIPPPPASTEVKPPLPVVTPTPETTAPPALAEPQPAPEVVKPPVPKPAPRAAVQPEPESSLWNYLALAAGLLAVGGGFTLLWLRKRKIEEEQNKESMFAASSQISLPSASDELLVPNVIDVAPGSPEESANSFLKDFGSDLTLFDSDHNEVDAISEADVYLAYGRYKQAEELMRTAITEEPARDDCKLKLLEVFYASKNKQAFENYASELAAAGKKNDPPFWSKVVEMGTELIPGAALFSAAKAFGVESDSVAEQPANNGAAVASNKKSEATLPGTSSENFFTDAADTGTSELADFNAQAKLPEATSHVDFNLAQLKVEDFASHSEASADATDSGVESYDFNLDAISADKAKLTVTDSKPAETDTGNLETFDFFAPTGTQRNQQSLDKELTFEDEKPSSSVGGESLATDLTFEDFTLDDYDFSEKKITEADEVETSLENAFQSLDALGAVPSGEALDVDGQEPGFNLSEMDELETKIDLAKAYVDMGDSEAAREIAKDVLAKGNDQQKREAQAILDGL